MYSISKMMTKIYHFSKNSMFVWFDNGNSLMIDMINSFKN
jgi:hypothetical protein